MKTTYVLLSALFFSSLSIAESSDPILFDDLATTLTNTTNTTTDPLATTTVADPTQVTPVLYGDAATTQVFPAPNYASAIPFAYPGQDQAMIQCAHQYGPVVCEKAYSNLYGGPSPFAGAGMPGYSGVGFGGGAGHGFMGGAAPGGGPGLSVLFGECMKATQSVEVCERLYPPPAPKKKEGMDMFALMMLMQMFKSDEADDGPVIPEPPPPPPPAPEPVQQDDESS